MKGEEGSFARGVSVDARSRLTLAGRPFVGTRLKFPLLDTEV